jgi:hypothetical protein
MWSARFPFFGIRVPEITARVPGFAVTTTGFPALPDFEYEKVVFSPTRPTTRITSPGRASSRARCSAAASAQSTTCAAEAVVAVKRMKVAKRPAFMGTPPGRTHSGEPDDGASMKCGGDWWS